MAVPKFEYFPTRAAFDTARGATTVFNNSVVFIEDTMELFTHGHFWTVSNLSQYYNSATQKLQLKNGSTVISELDASPFIKDGMLESVELITTPEGSGAVLSVNGTNYPIVELDANSFETAEYYGGVIASLIPQLNFTTTAYSVINSENKIFASLTVDENEHGLILKFDRDANLCIDDATRPYADVVSFSTLGISTNTWYTIPFLAPAQIGNYTAYNVRNSSDVDELSSATETTGSVSNNNYPALPYLKFTFNVASGKSIIRVSIAELFTVYNGDNVLLSSNYAKAQVYTEPAVGDKVDIAVGKLAKGIADNAAAIATKQATITGAATTITTNNLTASKALVSDANGKVAASSVTATELGYLSGVTSSIQTQLNAKANIADLGWVEH